MDLIFCSVSWIGFCTSRWANFKWCITHMCTKMLGSMLQGVHFRSPCNWSSAVNCKSDHGNEGYVHQKWWKFREIFELLMISCWRWGQYAFNGFPLWSVAYAVVQPSKRTQFQFASFITTKSCRGWVWKHFQMLLRAFVWACMVYVGWI